MAKRFPMCPCVDAALVATRAKFGYVEARPFSASEMEIAAKFDLDEQIRRAEEIQMKGKE